MKKFDPSIPREMFWSNDVGGKFCCPRCFSSLENESQAFLMAIRLGHDIHSFVVGNDAGYFCPKCPTIVLDSHTFNEFARLSLGCEADSQFAVLGLLDLQAIPKDKRPLPLGGNDNPIPLVKFTNMPERKSKRRKTIAQKKKTKRSKRKKLR
jgi:hypothetical protein